MTIFDVVLMRCNSMVCKTRFFDPKMPRFFSTSAPFFLTMQGEFRSTFPTTTSPPPRQKKCCPASDTSHGNILARQQFF